MQVKSIFKQEEKIPIKYTADGDDVNPWLEISEIPSNQPRKPKWKINLAVLKKLKAQKKSSSRYFFCIG